MNISNRKTLDWELGVIKLTFHWRPPWFLCYYKKTVVKLEKAEKTLEKLKSDEYTQLVFALNACMSTYFLKEKFRFR